jgi:hypothetical protein
MDMLARIPELSVPPRDVAARNGDGRPTADQSTPVPQRLVPPRRWPRVPAGSIPALALVAAAIWSLVAWRERQDVREARAAMRLARQFESAPNMERAR